MGSRPSTAVRPGLLTGLLIPLVLLSGMAAGDSAERRFSGRIRDAKGPVAGAMVSFRHGDPAHIVTVFSDEEGRYASPSLAFDSGYRVRVRRLGWKDATLDGLAPGPLDFALERETDPALLAEQLPANRWYQRVLDRIDSQEEREQLKQQCTYCHQQGNWATHRPRSEEDWRKLLALMGRRGGMLSRDLREKLPRIFIEAYDPATAVPALTAGMETPDFAPPPARDVRHAVIEEWHLGSRASVQHDLVVHPDGRIYSVDMSQDTLYRLDPSLPGGDRASWTLPHGDLEPGGVFASSEMQTSTANAYVGPHSLQVAPDGSIWITLALGNRLARFDPKTETFGVHELEAGIYPHTLRFDPKGRIWYTLAASNHLGMFDPATGEQKHLRLPARTLAQDLVLRAMPFLLWLGRHFDVGSSAAESDGFVLPVPYGVDVAPDGSVWFSQLNEHRLGRVDPETLELTMVPTPFPTPRRLRFDSQGGLWIPSFSGARLARFDIETHTFQSWQIPIEPLGSETPYAVHVRRSDDTVWICGTNSDTLIRFEPKSERFTVYPLPSRVTYTREIDFDAAGRVWTSNSNAPTWQIEGAVPQVIRLDPGGATSGSTAGAGHRATGTEG